MEALRTEALRTQPVPTGNNGAGPTAADFVYQLQILPKVSRTFALNIPQLPGPLRSVVTNAYLLCRIADTIEDEPVLSSAEKTALLADFSSLVEHGGSEGEIERFAGAAAAVLTGGTDPHERELVARTDAVLRVTDSFSEVQRSALARCVSIMSSGMHEFQQTKSPRGLERLVDLDRYCYYVAGVVGEMLTELFCDYLPELRDRKREMMRLAVGFGQGLQMTNILKDVWEDWRDQTSWLPREVFARHGFNLDDAHPGCRDAGFRDGMLELTAVARSHLARALEYTQMIPAREAGIRRFCLLAIGFAGLTLRNISFDPTFASGRDVKISRRAVGLTILASRAAAKSDRALHVLFDRRALELPFASVERLRDLSPLSRRRRRDVPANYAP